MNTIFAHSLSTGRLLIGALACVTFAILLLYHINPVGLGDMYWHLNTGRWIWENGALPNSDPFSYTQTTSLDAGTGQSSKNYWQLLILKGFWLAQLSYFAAYSALGEWGLVIFKAILFVTLYGLIWRSLLKSRVEPLLGLLAILILPWLLYRYDELRPQVFSFIGVVLVYMNMRTALEKLHEGVKHPAALISLPIIMMLWSNLHPGYMLGWVIIGVMAVGTAFDRWRGAVELAQPAFRNLLVWCGLALVASLFNPLADVIFSYLGIVQNQFAFGIDEHLPLYSYANMYQQPMLFYGVLTLALVMLGTLILRRKYIDSAHAFLMFGFTAAGFYAFRFTIFFILMAILIGMPHFSALFERQLAKLHTLLIAILLIAITGVGYQAVQNSAWKSGPVQTRYVPEHAADFILEQRPPAPIFNAYEYGGYLGWRLTPEYQIFIDPRCLEFEVNQDYQIARGGHYHAVFDKYGVNSVVFYLFTPLVNSIPEVTLYLLMDKHWDLVYVDRLTAVMVRRERNSLPIIDKAPLLNYFQRTLERTLQLYPNSTQALVQYGRVLLHRGDMSGAQQHFRTALKINPELTAARLYLDAISRTK
ncbi:MAG: hypothetical protein R8M11_10220 [Gallionella sp.]